MNLLSMMKATLYSGLINLKKICVNLVWALTLRIPHLTRFNSQLALMTVSGHWEFLLHLVDTWQFCLCTHSCFNWIWHYILPYNQSNCQQYAMCWDFSNPYWLECLGRHRRWILVSSRSLWCCYNQFERSIASSDLHWIKTNNIFWHQKSKVTWFHSQSQHSHVLDCIICSRGDLRDFCKIRVMHSDDSDTDYLMVRAELKFSFRQKFRFNWVKEPRRIYIFQLKDPVVRTHSNLIMNRWIS